MLISIVKFISTLYLQPHQISIVEICISYRISQRWKLDMFMHIGIEKSTHAVNLEHHQISAIEIQFVYHISQACSICFSLLVLLEKSLCTVNLLSSVHPTTNPKWNLTFFCQCQISFKLCIFPCGNHLRPLVFFIVHLRF